jgi:hypothetical protein
LPVERSKRRKWLPSNIDVLGILATSISIAGGVLALTFGISAFNTFNASKTVSDDVAIQQKRAEFMRRQLDMAMVDLSKLNARMDALLHEDIAPLIKPRPPNSYATLSPVDRQALKELKSNEEQLQGRMTSLETALVATPEKAIALPMLKQQMDMLQDRTRGDLDGVRGEMGRLFTMVQWCIGIIVTIGLAVLGISITNLRKGKSDVAVKA